MIEFLSDYINMYFWKGLPAVYNVEMLWAFLGMIIVGGISFLIIKLQAHD